MQTEDHYVEEYVPETLEEFLDFHAEAIDSIAKGHWNRQGFCQADDVAQEIRMHVMTKWDYYSGLGVEAAKRAFGKAAKQYLSQESQDYMHFTGNFVYTPRMVRALLETSAWDPVEEVFDVDGRIDIQLAFKTLPPARSEAVFKRYALKVPTDEMTKVEQRSCQRGVDDVCHFLNRQDAPRAVSLDELRHQLGLGAF